MRVFFLVGSEGVGGMEVDREFCALEGGPETDTVRSLSLGASEDVFGEGGEGVGVEVRAGVVETADGGVVAETEIVAVLLFENIPLDGYVDAFALPFVDGLL